MIERHARHHPPVAPGLDQGRLRGEVVVPDVVVHELLIPLDLAGVHVDREQRIAIQVVAVVRPPVIVVADLFDRHEQQAPLDVHGEDAPQAGRVLRVEAVVEPGRGVGVSGLGLEVQRPPQLAGDGVPGLDQARASLRHQDVLVDRAGRRQSHPLNDPLLAEARDQGAGLGVDGRQAVGVGREQARRQPVAAGPIRQPPPGRRGCLVLPHLLACRRVERVDPVRRAEIQHAVDDERRALEEAGLVAGVEGPGPLQAFDVLRVDLRQRRELGAAGILAERGPVVLPGQAG